jgi:glycerophosphoryl diester phosphodiesterase
MHFIKIVPPVIAHRGASAYAPENTLVSFLKAKELGARWLEFDVMLSADSEVVVIHDETIDRTTNAQGFVENYPYSFLKMLDAGGWFDREFLGEKIPLLSEVIDFLYQHQLSANIEIKLPSGNEEYKVKKIMDVITTHWRKDMAPPLISSFSVPALRVVRQYSAGAEIGLLLDEWSSGWEDFCDELECISVHVAEHLLTKEIIQKIRSTNRLVLGYTVNDPGRAKELFSFGIDAIFSNCPDTMLNALHLKRGE